jgi:hypothetical protein
MYGRNRAHVRIRYTTLVLLCLAEAVRAEDVSTGGPSTAIREARQSLANAGVTLEGSLTNFGQSVVSGDGNRDIAWGNRGDLILRFDGGKLGLWDGLSLTLHQEVVRETTPTSRETGRSSRSTPRSHSLR